MPAGMAGDELNEFNGIDKIFEGTSSFVPVSPLPFCFISLADFDLPDEEVLFFYIYITYIYVYKYFFFFYNLIYYFCCGFDIS